MTSRTIRALSFNLRRSGQGQPLVLVHGVGADLESWDGVVEALGPGYDVLRYDQRGHGLSSKPPGPYCLDDFVEDLHGLLRAEDIARAHLAGFSLGGLVAQAFALAHPDCVDKLVLISTVAGRTEQERERVLARAAKLAEQGAGAHLSDAVDRWFTAEFIAARPDVLAWRRAKSEQNDPASYAAAYRVLAESDLADKLHGISAPTLVMTGEGDIASTPRMARLIAERVPRSACVILPKLKHSVLLEAPKRVALEMGSFFDGKPPPT